MSLIRFERADLGYGTEAVLRDVNCSVERGEFVGLVGPNGAGKTTFLRSVLGVIPALAGKVAVDRGRRFAYVPQADELNLLWPVTVREAVLLPLRGARIFGRVDPAERAAAEEAMGRVGVAGIADRLLREVSGGQRQRTVLAQALSRRPDVLLLDEPTRGLDVVAEAEFLELVGRLRAERELTVLFVTHSLQIPLNYAGKILLFEGGRAVSATPGELGVPGRLEGIYGIPFVHGEAGGLRWVWPARKPG